MTRQLDCGCSIARLMGESRSTAMIDHSHYNSHYRENIKTSLSSVSLQGFTPLD